MTARYLLDTSVFSQPLRKNPVMASMERWRDVGDAACCVSAVSLAEVEFGLHLENRPERWEKFRLLLEGRLEVIPTDAGVWQDFAKRKARQQLMGRVVADLDLLIAATAAHRGLTVATLNGKDFRKMEGIALEDWSA
ncbi:MAG: type II toxin-antitoxin system VapC family toxin [Terrimicrobiaceae bacterium]